MEIYPKVIIISKIKSGIVIYVIIKVDDDVVMWWKNYISMVMYYKM